MKIINIKWDTDGDKEALECLPTEVELPDSIKAEDFKDEEEFLEYVSDYLSDTYNFCHFGFDLPEDFVFPKKNYMVTVTDSATYVIRAASEEDAINLAKDYFEERDPDYEVEITDEEAEVEI